MRQHAYYRNLKRTFQDLLACFCLYCVKFVRRVLPPFPLQEQLLLEQDMRNVAKTKNAARETLDHS